MGWGACLWGHALIAERIFDRYDPAELALGVGSTQTTRLRQRAEQQLVEWADEVWPGTPRLRVGILHTGAEAVEAALKTALAATGRTEIVAFEGAYHGSFGVAVAASDDADTRRAFEPTFRYQRLRHVPYGEVPELSDDTACVIVEPVQGSAGVVVPPEGFLDALREECDRVGALLVLDDVLAGCGRTGEPIEGIHCSPDIVVLAKALGGDDRVGRAHDRGRRVCGVGWRRYAEPVDDLLRAPVSCAAILEVLALHEEFDLVELCRPFERALRRVEDQTSLALRGKGAFWALAGGEQQGARVFNELLERGVIVDAAGNSGEVLSIKPSLLMREDRSSGSCRRSSTARAHGAGRYGVGTLSAIGCVAARSTRRTLVGCRRTRR